MLLLMVQPQHQHGKQSVLLRTRRFEPAPHVFIHVLPIFVYFLHPWAREHSPAGPAVALAYAVVIRIEKILVLGIEAAIVTCLGEQDKSFKKPARMRQMPFGWAGVGHGLDDLIFGRERLRQGFRGVADFQIFLGNTVPKLIRCR